jgi:hypothetical protein
MLFHKSCNKKSILSLLEFLNLFHMQEFNNKEYNAKFVYIFKSTSALSLIQ